MTRVIIADDHAVVRRGIKEILADAPDMQCMGEAASGREALQLAATVECDVLVLDIFLSDLSGLDVLKQLRAQHSAVKVLILSAYPEEQYAVRAFKSGAYGYLTKTSAPQELLEAIRYARQGRKYVSRALAEQLAASLGNEPAELYTTLSDRELQVLRGLAQGKNLNEIGAELALSPKTVSTYRARILDKLHLETTADLIRYALENNLIA